MDYLKSCAPFWKKETGPDGPRWIEPRDQDHADIERWKPATTSHSLAVAAGQLKPQHL